MVSARRSTHLAVDAAAAVAAATEVNPFHTRTAIVLAAWFLAIPLRGPDGNFPVCLKNHRPRDCDTWEVLQKFPNYNDCLEAEMKRRGDARAESKDLATAFHHVEDFRATCFAEGDPRLSVK